MFIALLTQKIWHSGGVPCAKRTRQTHVTPKGAKIEREATSYKHFVPSGAKNSPNLPFTFTVR